MKIVLSRPETEAILKREARIIGDKACPDGMQVLEIDLPTSYGSGDLTIKIGVPETKETANVDE